MSRGRELALLAGSLALGLLLAEAGLRLYYSLSYAGTIEDLTAGAAPPPAGSDVYLGQILSISASPRLVYRLLPGLDVRFRDAALRTNSQGWREEEILFAKEPGTVRLAGIGDSVLFGWGVEEWERYMDRLEQGLALAYPDRRWQSLALAVPGYNLVMEVEALERFGLEYSPDLILVGFSTNDFCLPNFVAPRHSVWSSESFLGLYLARGRMAAPGLVDRLSVLLDAPGTGVPDGEGPGEERAEAPPRGVEFFAAYCSPGNVPGEYRDLVGAENFLDALARLVKIGRERGVPVVFLHQGIGQGFVPLGDPDAGVPAEITRALAAVREIEGLVVADLTPEIRRLLAAGSVKVPDLVLSSSDPHPSVQGHRLVADLLLRFLAERGILDRLSGREPPASL